MSSSFAVENVHDQQKVHLRHCFRFIFGVSLGTTGFKVQSLNKMETVLNMQFNEVLNGIAVTKNTTDCSVFVVVQAYCIQY